MASWGLIAGLSLHDMMQLPPGFVMDAYIYRKKYGENPQEDVL